MAMMMAAQPNGVGMVGIWPALRIVSVRVAGCGCAGRGVSTFPFVELREGDQQVSADAAERAVRVTELALGEHADASPTDRTSMIRLMRAHASASALSPPPGNDGGPLGEPAAVPLIFAVAASDDPGFLCAFSSRGPSWRWRRRGVIWTLQIPSRLPMRPATTGQVRLRRSTAAVLAALRAYNPSLTWSAARGTAPRHARDGALDAAAAFRAAGLGRRRRRGLAAMPPADRGRTTRRPAGCDTLNPLGRAPARPGRPRVHVCAYPVRAAGADGRGGESTTCDVSAGHHSTVASTRLRTVRTVDRRLEHGPGSRDRDPARVRVEYVDAQRSCVSPTGHAISPTAVRVRVRLDCAVPLSLALGAGDCESAGTYLVRACGPDGGVRQQLMDDPQRVSGGRDRCRMRSGRGLRGMYGARDPPRPIRAAATTATAPTSDSWRRSGTHDQRRSRISAG